MISRGIAQRSVSATDVATAGFETVTGQEMQGLDEFFGAYEVASLAARILASF